MTEQEWITSADPDEMSNHVEWDNPQKTVAYRSRKAMLFACALCRMVGPLLTCEWSRRAAIVVEEYADGRLGMLEVQAEIEAEYRLGIIDEEAFYPTADYVPHGTLGLIQTGRARLHLASQIGRGAFSVMLGVDPWSFEAGQPQCDLIRELYGNPFRPIALDPRRQTSTVIDLARIIYDERAFDRMPILADALMDAGCDSEDILNHCRSDAPHVRGCWVVDLILGKE